MKYYIPRNWLSLERPGPVHNNFPAMAHVSMHSNSQSQQNHYKVYAKNFSALILAQTIHVQHGILSNLKYANKSLLFMLLVFDIEISAVMLCIEWRTASNYQFDKLDGCLVITDISVWGVLVLKQCQLSYFCPRK